MTDLKHLARFGAAYLYLSVVIDTVTNLLGYPAPRTEISSYYWMVMGIAGYVIAGETE